MFPQLIHWIVIYPVDNDIQLITFERLGPGGGGVVIDISLGGEVRLGPLYPDPVKDKNR